jgi:hypothetical protein
MGPLDSNTEAEAAIDRQELAVGEVSDEATTTIVFLSSIRVE